MPWHQVSPSATQPEGTNGFVWWNTFRPIWGQVEMNLYDVTSGDYQWSTCRLHVQLRSQAGALLASKSIYKTWGVNPGFVSIGYVPTLPGGQQVQLGTWIDLMPYDSPYNSVSWYSHLRWI